MTRRSIALAVGDYDHTRDLVFGVVQARGLTLQCIGFDRPEEMFDRFLRDGEFDAAEMSLAVYAALRSIGDERFVALPIFPARSFRHSAISVRQATIAEPADLAGRRVGVPVWVQTAGVYARGLLAHDYGVVLEDVKWVQAGVDEPGRREPVEASFPAFSITERAHRSLDELLRAGDIDAVISARPPNCVRRREAGIIPLFPDPIAVESAYFRRTGIFPIMHVVVIRRAVLAANPAIATSLCNAFEQAKCRSLERAGRVIVPAYPLPWAGRHAAGAADLLGADFWPYGVANNERALSALLEFAAEQQITARRLRIDELFDSVALSWEPSDG
jgi:4,5-dihydroxyphthalate decarboxylase